MATPKSTGFPRPAPRSWTLVHFLPHDFSGFRTANLVPGTFPDAVFRTKNHRRPALLTSPEIRALFPFSQLLLSADIVSGGAFEAQARVKTSRGWSPWFSWGRFAPGRGRSAPVTENAFGKMDTDILRLAGRATAFRYRVKLFPAGKPARLRLAAACYTDASLPYSPAPRPAPAREIKLPLPARSQMALKVRQSKDICSPVSLSMALEGLGLKAGPLDTAAAARDHEAGIYGNWFFNTAYAGTRGVYSLLTRMNTLEEARAFIEEGIPVIASLTFGPGELRNSPIRKTSGHLMVIVGFTRGGDVIVHDPAAPSASSVRRTYRRRDFERAWLGNKFGLAYLVTRSLGRFMSVKAPYTELYRSIPKDVPERKKFIETQLLFNERAELLELAGEWARVRALEQTSLRADGRTMQPYEGWVRSADISFELPVPPTASVAVKFARAGGEKHSLGIRLHAASGTSLPAPGLKAAVLRPLAGKFSEARLRSGILKTARFFIGDKYYWGGRSACCVDCSGLISLAFRAWGLDLPRNADDQYYVSRKIGRESLKPGDLLFSSDASEPSNITHVMIYSGRGRLVEATSDSNSVREISFRRKFGVPFAGARNGMVAGGRKVFFRRFIGR